MKPITNKGYKLLHNGCIALSQVEANGMRIDTEYINKAITRTSHKIEKITLRMKEDKIFKIWRRELGKRINMGSREQLGRILFSVMNYPCSTYTDTGRAKVDETVLAMQIKTDEGDDIMIVLRPGRYFKKLSCDAVIGQRIGQGHRCGIIPFGSCVDVYVPVTSSIKASIGDHVEAGTSFLASLKHHS